MNSHTTHNSSQETGAEASKPEATDKPVAEIGEEAAPAAVPAAASPLKPIVLKLTSNKPPAEDAATAEDPLKTVESADELAKSADEQAKSADEQVKSADEPVKTTEAVEETETAGEASEKPAMVLNPIAVAAAAKKAESTDAMDAEEKLFYEAVKDPSEEVEPSEETEEKQTTEKDVQMEEEEVDPMDAIADPDELGWLCPDEGLVPGFATVTTSTRILKSTFHP